MTYFFWLGHEHHDAKREWEEREQLLREGPVIEEGDDG